MVSDVGSNSQAGISCNQAQPGYKNVEALPQWDENTEKASANKQN